MSLRPQKPMCLPGDIWTKPGGDRSQAGGGTESCGGHGRPSREEGNRLKPQGLHEEARAESLTGSQKGAAGLQSDQCGQEEEVKKRRGRNARSF